MIAHIVNWAVHKRWLVLTLTALAAIIGGVARNRARGDPGVRIYALA